MAEENCNTPNGSYKILINDCLKSNKNVYTIQSLLGRGAFGQVVKCTNRLSKRDVAVKVIGDNSICENNESARKEIKTLQMIMKIDQGRNFVQAIDFFEYKNHTCIAFEMLEQNLYQFIKNQHTIPSQAICYILNQLLSGLSKLKKIKIVHADLKPENIMMVNSIEFPYRVKIIDVGCAQETDKIPCGSYITTRPYRSPEVILGLPCNEKIDMWSLGCIAAELLTKHTLYYGVCELEQLRCIYKTQGRLPKSMLNEGVKTELFFDNYCDVWIIKRTEHGRHEVRGPLVHRLNDLITMNISDALKGEELQADIVVRTKIVDLITKMLQLDPKNRISCVKALKHEAVSRHTRWNIPKFCSKL